MKLKKLGNNETELITENGTRILFSYETPVAVINIHGDKLVTEQHYSKTTSRHINKWIGKVYSDVHVPQSIIDNLTKFHQSHLETKHDN